MYTGCALYSAPVVQPCNMEQRLYFIKDIHVQFAWARLFSLAYRVAQFRLALIEIDYITCRLSGRILIRVTYKIS